VLERIERRARRKHPTGKYIRGRAVGLALLNVDIGRRFGRLFRRARFADPRGDDQRVVEDLLADIGFKARRARRDLVQAAQHDADDDR